MISTIFLTYLTRTIPEIVSEYDQEIPDLFTKLPILRTFYRQARIQDFLPGGGGGEGGGGGVQAWLSTTIFFVVFLVLNSFYNFTVIWRKLKFPKVSEGGPTFSRGGGGGVGGVSKY